MQPQELPAPYNGLNLQQQIALDKELHRSVKLIRLGSHLLLVNLLKLPTRLQQTLVPGLPAPSPLLSLVRACLFEIILKLCNNFLERTSHSPKGGKKVHTLSKPVVLYFW